MWNIRLQSHRISGIGMNVKLNTEQEDLHLQFVDNTLDKTRLINDENIIYSKMRMDKTSTRDLFIISCCISAFLIISF